MRIERLTKNVLIVLTFPMVQITLVSDLFSRDKKYNVYNILITQHNILIQSVYTFLNKHLRYK